MFQINEVMALVFCLIGAVLLVFLVNRKAIPAYPRFIASFFCVVASNVFTVAEGFVFYDAFNLMEHFSYLAAACFFLAGVIQLIRVRK